MMSLSSFLTEGRRELGLLVSDWARDQHVRRTEPPIADELGAQSWGWVLVGVQGQGQSVPQQESLALQGSLASSAVARLRL